MLAVTPSVTHNGERGFALAEGHISCMKGEGSIPRLVHLFKPLGLSLEAQLTPKVQHLFTWQPVLMSEHQPHFCICCQAGRSCSLCIMLSNMLVACMDAALCLSLCRHREACRRPDALCSLSACLPASSQRYSLLLLALPSDSHLRIGSAAAAEKPGQLFLKLLLLLQRGGRTTVRPQTCLPWQLCLCTCIVVYPHQRRPCHQFTFCAACRTHWKRMQSCGSSCRMGAAPHGRTTYWSRCRAA